MIAVKLWGGLGNQMFQYAFGLFLEQKRAEPVGFYRIDSGKNDRALDLTKFKVNLKLYSTEEIRRHFVLGQSGLLYRAERKVLKSLPRLNTAIFVEPASGYTTAIPEKAILFDGYWQSYKYIDPVADKLRNHFSFREIPGDYNNIVQKIDDSNSVSIHIRRSDYLLGRQKRIYATCSKQYYSRTIEIIRKTIEDPNFFVFSDDIEWSSDFLNLMTDKVVYVDNRNYNDSHLRDFYLMSRCKHNIIANSTFSWWGAWFNQNPEKIVIAPKQWYNGKLNEFTSDLIPKNWIRI